MACGNHRQGKIGETMLLLKLPSVCRIYTTVHGKTKKYFGLSWQQYIVLEKTNSIK